MGRLAYGLALSLASIGAVRSRPMQAWTLRESPGEYRFEEIDDPLVGAGDVRIRPVASALNHMDLWLTRGRPRPRLPHVPGCDVAGVVESVGDAVEGVHVGQEVVVNPAVCPLESVVRHGDDAPMYPGLEIVGEGAETEWQYNELVRMGCDQVQGYYLGRPMPIEELDAFMSRFARAPV